MGKFEFVITAEIPDGSSIEIEFLEDIDGDGEFENCSLVPLQEGRNKYIVDGLDGSRDNRYATHIHLQREDVSSNPSVSNPRMSRPGKTGNSLSEKSIHDKASQAKFFLDRIHESSPPESRYHLNGFLNAVYSIKDILSPKNIGFDDWAASFENPGPMVALHDYMMEARRSTTHLGVHSDSEFRPPVGHTTLLHFGEVGDEESGETRVQGEIREEQLTFVKVPEEVLAQIESSETWPDIEPIDAVIGDKQAEQRSVPISILCEIYFNQVASWISELEPALSFIEEDIEMVLNVE